MTSKLIDHAVPLIRAVVIHPDRRSDSPRLASERLEEAAGLARALDLDVRAEEIVRLRSTTPATLFGTGKVEELAALVRAAEDFEDQAGAVDDLHLPGLFQIALLDRRQGVVDHGDVGVQFVAERADLIDLAAAEQGRWRAFAQGRDDRVPDFQIEGQGEADRFLQARIGAARGFTAVSLRMDDKRPLRGRFAFDGLGGQSPSSSAGS